MRLEVECLLAKLNTNQTVFFILKIPKVAFYTLVLSPGCFDRSRQLSASSLCIVVPTHVHFKVIYMDLSAMLRRHLDTCLYCIQYTLVKTCQST